MSETEDAITTQIPLPSKLRTGIEAETPVQNLARAFRCLLYFR